MSTKTLLAAAVSGLLMSGLAAAGDMGAMGADKSGAMEKCAGVVKAGKNDCAANGHACAGQAKADNDAKEWIKVPKGTCEKLTGGKVVGK
jgi:uncharacterized membrane protein